VFLEVDDAVAAFRALGMDGAGARGHVGVGGI